MDRCENCAYYKDPDTKYGKGECTWYNCSYYPEEEACSHFKSRDPGGCYLTTACCGFHGLPDDCHELTVMRRFRDTYLKEQPYGEGLIRAYYQDAPVIVRYLDRQPDKAAVYEDIFRRIHEIVALVESRENDQAVIRYMDMVYGLYRRAFPAGNG